MLFIYIQHNIFHNVTAEKIYPDAYFLIDDISMFV